MAPSESTGTSDSTQEYGLIVRQEGKSQHTLAKFISLFLNYRFGIQTDLVDDLIGAAGALRQRGKRTRCVFVIQNTAVSTRTTVPALTLKGTIPLFLVFPGHVATEQEEAGGELTNVHICRWELAFTQDEGSLQRVVAEGMLGDEVDAIFGSGEKEAQNSLADRVRTRLDQLDTLPTLPAVVLHIMRLISDPKTTISQLEELLLRDPAIVLKVLQVANSPVFAGAGHKGRWTLKDALVRMGLRKVGAIAQQIALINTFVRPEESDFDLERFWQHSVGCALVANELCEGQMVKLAGPVEFNDFWIASLLHDAGKLVQGFFYYEWFERILRQMDGGKTPYHQAESEMSAGISHGTIGELLLEKSGMPAELNQAVGLHHTPGESPAPLVALVHVADNVTKDIGLGYVDGEKGDYSRPALAALGLSREGVRKLNDALGELVTGEVRALVKQCMES